MNKYSNKESNSPERLTFNTAILITLPLVLTALLLGLALVGCGNLPTDETPILKGEEMMPEGGEIENAGQNDVAGERGDGTAAESYATYQISYGETGIPISELPIGSRIVDLSWQWQYRRGDNYSDENDLGEAAPPGEVKAVTWILVAKNHYTGLEPHVTLLAEELIGLYVFDNCSDRREKYDPYDHGGHNHWGKSGTTNAKNGLRPWLNSSGIHSGEGFYRAFSDNFRGSILLTTLPNWDFESRKAYDTADRVFIPSSTELGDRENLYTQPIGQTYSYFSDSPADKLAAVLGNSEQVYWTRSPHSFCADEVDEERFNGCEEYPGTLIGIDEDGEFTYIGADYIFAVRPALNLKAGVTVVEIAD